MTDLDQAMAAIALGCFIGFVFIGAVYAGLSLMGWM